MNISYVALAAARAQLFGRPRNGILSNTPEFRVRPISIAWALANRTSAYKTAVANVAYIWRDDTATDQFAPMPRRFAERRCELQGAGLIVPASAPVWASKGYTIWEEADAAAAATLDICELSAWHVIMQIPATMPADWWRGLMTGFIDRELTSRGAAVAWAIHALNGDNGWIVEPHAHLVVTARHWRHDYRHGRRHPGWIGGWRAQRRLEMAWRLRCRAAMGLGRWSLR